MKKYGKKYGGGKYVESHVTSGDVTSGQACARHHFRLLPFAPPQIIWLELCPYTTVH
jgi:hypothetical protein